MRGRRSLLSAVTRRIGLGLLAAAATVLLAPVAAATPETDANDAITAAWVTNGGPTGPLGARQGDVYPVGGGFGQDFAGGKIFFTPASGARIMQGAILAKYEALGGPADSDLGFPTIDEGPGRIGPDSRNTIFSASDKPVIFWTPATGAHVVRGAINAAWDKLGGSAGPLGVPAEDEVFRGDIVSQKFTGGQVAWNRRDNTFTTVPPELADQLKGLAVPSDPTSAINAARRASGGPLGPLGAAQGPQYPIGTGGFGQDFAGGKIFYSPETGANVVTGQVLEKYESVGGPEGDLGFPTSSEVEGGLGPNSRMVTFSAEDEPVIFWTPDYGPVIVRGAMNAAWAKLDGAAGALGAPVADQTENGDVVTQRFSGGVVSWDKTTNRFTTEPPNLAAPLSGLQVPGVEPPKAPPTAPQAAADDADKSFRFHWNWWWLLALVPVVVLAALVGGAVLWNRSRRDDDGRFDENPFGGGHDQPARAGDDDILSAERYGEVTAAPRGPGPAEGPWGFAPTGDTAGGSLPAAAPGDLFGGEPDPDSVDTTPTRIESVDAGEDPTGHGVAEVSAEPERADATDEEAVAPEAVMPEPAGEEVPVPLAVPDEGDVMPRWVDAVSDEGGGTPEPTGEEVAAPGGDGGAPPELVETAPAAEDAESESHTGRHAAISIEEPTPGRTAIHLPLDDPREAPDGYLIKANIGSGLYWSPGSDPYDDAVAEIWFASEEFARTNGFVKGE
ncbi:MAG: hypothetical protein JST91_19555 [Actinobacteria bacterium]|nr:hypothetical protein [Actinomycetota bacterium]